MTIMMALLMVWLCLENEVVALILLSKGSIFAFPPVNIKIKIFHLSSQITELPKLSESVGIVNKYWQSPISSNLPSNISSRGMKISDPLIFGFKKSHYLCSIFHPSSPSSSSLSSSPSSSPPPLILGLSVVFSVRQQPRQPILAKLQADNRHCFYQLILFLDF